MGARIINRQRVVNQWGSPHIDLPPWEFGSPEDDPSYPKPRHYGEEIQDINEEIDRIAARTRGSVRDLKKLDALYKKRAAVTEESIREMRNPASSEESVQERSYREWRENFQCVSADPESASITDLMRAIGYLDHRRSSIQQHAWAQGKKVDANVLAGYDNEQQYYQRLIEQKQGRRRNQDFEFVPQRLIPELANLWHLSKTAVGTGRLAEMERIDWTVDEFHNAHPELSHEHIFRDLAAMVRGY